MITSNLFGDDENDDYARRKERSRKQQAEQARKGRDVGPLPAPVDVTRRNNTRNNLRLFLETYLHETFNLEWSEDHLRVIAKLETVVLEGGQFALAMPRGQGKTSLVVGATLWAALGGHRRFIVAVGATKPLAEGMLDSIKSAIETNDVLAGDFPEAAVPVRKLDGINNRSAGQLLDGKRTRIKWTGSRLVFASVDGAASSGVVVHAAGLTGSLRGLQMTLPDGSTIRPDLVLPDDPQTDESARRPAQTATRLKIIEQTIMGLAGPDKTIAVICPCTVIAPDDLADQLLNRQTHLEWLGERTKLLYQLPTRLDLWDRYRELRADSMREFEDARLAAEFYAANRADMDAGAVPSWPARFKPGQLSAIQFAMDLRAANEEVFLAEYQNDPKVNEESGIETLKAAQLLERCNGVPRGVVPDWATRLTAYVDVQQDVLLWMVAAWGDDLTGAVIDYGSWPDQGRRYFTLRDLAKTMRGETGENTVEAALDRGLQSLVSQLLEYGGSPRLAPAAHKSGERGEPTALAAGGRRIDWIGIDANWQISTELVYQTARTFGAGRVMPCHGRFVGAASLPMTMWRKVVGEREGHFYRVCGAGGSSGTRAGRHLAIDINSWKSIVCKRCKAEPNKPGSITWFGDRARSHELLCDQLSAEFAVKVSGRGRRVDEWKNRPGRDNHWWDCLVGCAVGASYLGATIPGQVAKREKRRINFAELQKQAKAGELGTGNR